MRDRMLTRRERRRDGLCALVASATIIGSIITDRILNFPETNQLVIEVPPEMDAAMRSVRDPLILEKQGDNQSPPMISKEDQALAYEGITVVLDAGHGMGNSRNELHDSGAVYGNAYESRMVLDQALRVGEILESQGFNVVYIRTDESVNTPLIKRAVTANNVNADIFVSLHVNSYEDYNVRGVRTYHYPGSINGNRLARTTGDSLVKKLSESVQDFNQDYDPVRNGDFNVLRRTKMPAVLIESGFLTNAKDRDYLVNSPQDVAEGIADGIIKYFASNKN
jgi:N-acetylmuramoyl-L-alanine amidase